MGLIAFLRGPALARDSYRTPAEHRQEAERLAWVIDDVLQSEAERSLGDLIAIARLHLDLASTPAPVSGTPN